MDFASIERAFSRAWGFSFSRPRLLLTFPVLLLCGLLTVFCRAAAENATEWVAMSLAFLPILLSSGVLLALGTMLARIHVHEVKGLKLGLRRLIAGSLDLVIGASYLSIAPVMAYLCLWIVLGFFYLLNSLPGVGNFFSIVFAFGPFLLIFISLLLCVINLAVLFFAAPVAASQSWKRISLARRVLFAFKGKILSSLVLFILALLPLAALVGLLSLAGALCPTTNAIALEWFFLMIPFAACLTPAVTFFFSFAVESFLILAPA